jgi:hypothetical protein
MKFNDVLQKSVKEYRTFIIRCLATGFVTMIAALPGCAHLNAPQGIAMLLACAELGRLTQLG